MNYVLITGASAGIGEELARLYAERGCNLILAARRESRLLQLKQELESKYAIDVQILAKDITVHTGEIYDYCREHDLKVDILVNNAGYGMFGNFADSSLERTLGMIDLNNRALVELTYLFVNDMKKRHYGHVLNVGSVASFMPGPYMSVYYATKAFVLSFSLGLREELKSDGIGVSVLCPAPTKTEFWDVADGSVSNVYDLVSRTGKQAALTGMHAVDHNLPYAIDGPLYKLSIPFARILPPALSAGIIGFVQRRTKK